MFRDLYDEVRNRQAARNLLREFQQKEHSADTWYIFEDAISYLQKTIDALIELPEAFGVEFWQLAEMYDTQPTS